MMSSIKDVVQSLNISFHFKYEDNKDFPHLVCLVLAVASTEHNPHPRIVGGESAEDGQFPHQALFRKKSSGDFFCSGSILSNRFMLTAAHCMSEKTPENIYAVVGTLNRLEGGTTVAFDKITVHPEWNLAKLNNDIALLRTANEIEFTTNVRPIALSKRTLPEEGNTQVILSGWGKTSLESNEFSESLQFIRPKTLKNKDCARKFGLLPLGRFIRESVICTTNEKSVGACFGDSGGPLVVETDSRNKELVGVTSWTVPCAFGFPDIFTRVHYYLDWIEQNIEQQSNNLE